MPISREMNGWGVHVDDITNFDIQPNVIDGKMPEDAEEEIYRPCHREGFGMYCT